MHKKLVSKPFAVFSLYKSSDHTHQLVGATVLAEKSIDGGTFTICKNQAFEQTKGKYKIYLDESDYKGCSILLKFSAVGADTLYKLLCNL